MVETIGIQKKALEEECDELRSRVEQFEHSRTEGHATLHQSAARHGI